MSRAPSLDDIFAVISAASVGERSARVVVPDDSSPDDPLTKLAVGLNVLLDDLAFRAAEQERAIEELRKSETGFRLLFANNPHPMWVYDFRTLQFVEVNDAAVSHYGYARDEFEKMRITDIRPPDDVPRLLEDLAQTRPAMQFSGEWRHRRKHGDIIDVEIASHRFTLSGRDVVLVVAHDITARKQAELQLRHQSELYEMVAQAQSALGEAVVVAERGERIIYVNDAYERIHGYSKEEILSLPSALVMVHPDEREKLAERVRRHAGGGLVPEHYETRIIHKSGRTVDIEVATQPIPRDGTFLVVAIVRDITERKQAEATLREREHRLRSIYNTVADVIFHLEVEPDGGYRFASVNPAFSSVTGVPEDAVIGKRVHEIIPEPSLSFVLDRYREAIRERKIVRWEETSDYPTGRLTGEVSVAPVFDASDTCTHLVGAVHDITERKRTEVEREQLLAREQEARAEVERLNVELEQRVANRTEQLEAANKELEAFSYSVAHDLRAPLRAIDGFSRLVVDGYGASLPDDARRYLDRVQQGARHMGELIDDLLTFSQLARQPLRRQRIDTRHLVEQVIAHLQPEHAAGTAAIRVAELPSVEADPALLRQVFANVLSNALKFTRSRAEPRIDVTHQADGGEVVFVVRDNGVGFDMRYVDKLFGVFQRLHRAEDYEGTGVGLAIVQRIIHRHGGRVWAEAEIDKGATFYFTLGATDDGERSS